ncbi:hypothetical protein DMI60_12690 [Escherichia coli]|nr:hypothetical protein [Escherichia coli]
MNPSGVISLAIPCYMVKRNQKGCFYTEKSDWQYVAATSADVVDYWRWLALLWFSRFQNREDFY